MAIRIYYIVIPFIKTIFVFINIDYLGKSELVIGIKIYRISKTDTFRKRIKFFWKDNFYKKSIKQIDYSNGLPPILINILLR